MTSLTGVGTGVEISDRADSFKLTLDCLPASSEDVGCGDSSTAFGCGGLEGTGTFRVSNLPEAFGEDEARAVTFSAAFALVNPTAIKQQILNDCPSLAPITTGDMRRFAEYVGTHEGLHVMGFSHAESGVMNPFGQCQQGVPSVPAPYRNALSLFNGGGAGVNIFSTGIGGFDPD